MNKTCIVHPKKRDKLVLCRVQTSCLNRKCPHDRKLLIDLFQESFMLTVVSTKICLTYSNVHLLCLLLLFQFCFAVACFWDCGNYCLLLVVYAAFPQCNKRQWRWESLGKTGKESQRKKILESYWPVQLNPSNQEHTPPFCFNATQQATSGSKHFLSTAS